MSDEVIEHYGVKGMHWGVRKTANASVPASKDHTVSRDLMAKPVHSLSNQEIETVNKRLGLETRMSQLNPSKLDKGVNMVKKIIGLHGTAKAAQALIPKKPNPAGA